MVGTGSERAAVDQVAASAPVVVRPIRESDHEGVVDLYRGLSPESIHSRFFTGSLPPLAYFERLVDVRARGGVGFVAELDDGTIVGEVDVEPLPDGNGELAVTVDEAWRGWLGPHLVARAGVEAARLGMPGLELQVLTSNRAMRAITRARGEAFIAPSDWHDVRVLVASVGRAAEWPRTDRIRVLIEQDHVSFDAIRAIRDAGWFAVVCAGRTTDRARGLARCPLLSGIDCPLAAAADVIVVALVPGPERDELLARHRSDEVPVVALDPGRGTAIGPTVVGLVAATAPARRSARTADGPQTDQAAVSVGSRPSPSNGPEVTTTVPSGMSTDSAP